MERVLTYKLVREYLESLATKHMEINDFCGMSVQQLADKISSTAGINSPIMVFFGYQWKLDGNNQRAFNTRSLSFSILYNNIKNDDFEAQEIAENNAERIGLEVLSRIHIDSLMPETGWLYKNFLKESVIGRLLEREGADGFYGMEFHFDLKVLETLMVTKDMWTDGDRFCN